MKLLEGKSAIITGSSRGIGKAIASAFALHGAGLIETSRKTPDFSHDDIRL